MKLVPFQFEHLDLFAWKPGDQEIYNIGSEFIEALRKAEVDSFTLIADGRIMGVGGIIKRTEKTGYCFTAVSRYAKPIVARLVKRQLKAMMRDMGLHRVVTYNRVQADHHHRWCEWLGFELEGKVCKFDDEGNDFLQYGLVAHGN